MSPIIMEMKALSSICLSARHYIDLIFLDVDDVAQLSLVWLVFNYNLVLGLTFTKFRVIKLCESFRFNENCFFFGFQWSKCQFIAQNVQYYKFDLI